MDEEEKKLYNQAITKFGKNGQISVAIEEMAELMQVLVKVIRSKANYAHIAEEMADVKIMHEQLTLIFDNEELVNKIKEEKLKMLKELVKK